MKCLYCGGSDLFWCAHSAWHCRVCDQHSFQATDAVDSQHQDRDCPYCGGRQRWIDDPEGKFESHYFHTATNRRYCDEERLARWDMAESLKKIDPT